MSGFASDGSGSTPFRVVDGLAFAAAPIFAFMALLTAVAGDGPMDVLCGGGQGFMLGGMTPMYLLMSAFHMAPWLRLISGKRRQSA